MNFPREGEEAKAEAVNEEIKDEIKVDPGPVMVPLFYRTLSPLGLLLRNLQDASNSADHWFRSSSGSIFICKKNNGNRTKKWMKR